MNRRTKNITEKAQGMHVQKKLKKYMQKNAINKKQVDVLTQIASKSVKNSKRFA